MKMEYKGMSLEDCIKISKKLISKRGICLLLFDVKNSKEFKDRNELNKQLKYMMKDLNTKFDVYFPENNLAVYNRKEKGFEILLGDGSWAGINSAEKIKEIIEYQKKTYPDIPLSWGIAKDGWDKKQLEIVR